MGSKVYTLTETLAQDQRVAVEGGVTTLVAPGSAVGGPGTITAAPDSTVSQSVSMTGLGANDIGVLMDRVFENNQASQEVLGNLAGSLAAGSQDTQGELTDVVKATQAPIYAQTEMLVPLLIIAVLAYIFLVKL